ncbi:MAG: sulfotransferase [Gaiellaceae bacterium]
MTGTLQAAGLQLRAARHLIRRGRGPLRARLGPLDDRLVFVLGSPRSGTTFLGSSIGSLPGFVDLGEVTPLKAAIPGLAGLPPDEAAARLRSILETARRLGLLGGLRALEQTPETAFVAPALARAYPAARFVHIVRDGRDVVCSLLERGWLTAGRGGGDDAGHAYGAKVRFWVESERREEFEEASDARRAAWAWRRYVEAGRAATERSVETRYEQVANSPDSVAATLAGFLDAPEEPLAEALRAAHASSIGRFRHDLTKEQLEDVEAEAGALLDELGYLRSV